MSYCTFLTAIVEDGIDTPLPGIVRPNIGAGVHFYLREPFWVYRILTGR